MKICLHDGVSYGKYPNLNPALVYSKTKNGIMNLSMNI